jgi:metal-responsive CopG/Arc/MetJ family transcriptional regulator
MTGDLDEKKRNSISLNQGTMALIDEVAGKNNISRSADNQNALVHGLFTRDAKQQRAAARVSVSLMAHLTEASNSQVKSAGADSTSLYNNINRRSI